MTTYQEPISTQVWEPNIDHPGYLRCVRTKTVQEVFEELGQRCMEPSQFGWCAEGCDEYFMAMPDMRGETLWPEGRIVVFAVTGSSEGHYTHVEVLGDSERRLVILGKTFDGWDNAWEFAKRLAETLGV